MCLLYASEPRGGFIEWSLWRTGWLILAVVSVGNQPQVVSFGAHFLDTLSASADGQAEGYGNFLEPDPEKILSFLFLRCWVLEEPMFM